MASSLSLCGSTQDTRHLLELQQRNIPLVFFDRVCENITAPKVMTNDYESGFVAYRTPDQGGLSSRRPFDDLHEPQHLSQATGRIYRRFTPLGSSPVILKWSFMGSRDEEESYRLIRELSCPTGGPMAYSHLWRNWLCRPIMFAVSWVCGSPRM